MPHLVVKSVSLEFNFSTKYLPKVTKSSSWRFLISHRGKQKPASGKFYSENYITYLILWTDLFSLLKTLVELSNYNSKKSRIIHL